MGSLPLLHKKKKKDVDVDQTKQLIKSSMGSLFLSYKWYHPYLPPKAINFVDDQRLMVMDFVMGVSMMVNFLDQVEFWTIHKKKLKVEFAIWIN